MDRGGGPFPRSIPPPAFFDLRWSAGSALRPCFSPSHPCHGARQACGQGPQTTAGGECMTPAPHSSRVHVAAWGRRRLPPLLPPAAPHCLPASAAMERRHSHLIVCDPSPAVGAPLHLPGRQGGSSGSSGRGTRWARPAQACPAQADPQSQVFGEGGSHGPDHQQRRRGQGACMRAAGLQCPSRWLEWCEQGPCLGRHWMCSELLSCLSAACAAFLPRRRVCCCPVRASACS